MAAPKGHPKWGGREKGTPNKLTKAAKEAIELAFEGAGGVAALTEWAKRNDSEFYTLVWARILPPGAIRGGQSVGFAKDLGVQNNGV